MHNGVSQSAGVVVTVPARLHLGFLDLNGSLGRRFGGIGLAVGGLATAIAIRTAKRPAVSGSETSRVAQYLETMEQALGLDAVHAIDILEVVPAHAGLGSGTQLALAVAAGLRRLHALPLDIEGDAMRLGRGARSGLGVGLFRRGGLVVDGGRGAEPKPAPIVSRLPFPNDWRIVVVLDPRHQGLHGAGELTAFAELRPIAEAQAAHICRLVVIKALPALADHDLVGFGAAIKEIQTLLGDYFAPAQGGARFTSRDVAAVLDALESCGAYGIGQSSWGPTGFAFAPSPAEAERLATMAREHPNAQGLDIRVCNGLNHGARIAARLRTRQPRPQR